MKSKLWKLALAAALLTESLTLGLAPKPAHAICYPICCNASCTSIRSCYGPACNICDASCHSTIQS